jgi:serine/threonine protein kinase
MGVVYLVRDLELKRSVALKTLQSSDNEQLRRRFLREARITAQLSHPNITPIYSYGILLDGRPTISMPIVGRNTLAFELEGRSRAEISRTLHYYLDVFLKVCDAVAYAHHRGIIHRDIKPENVLIGAYGGVQLVDWGLAYVKKDPASEDLDLRHDSRDTQMSAHIDPGMTVVGTIIGTPSFMPPEQALGKTHELDERSDIFALGGILHCILTGTPPNTGSSLTDCLRAAIAGIRPPSHSLAPSNVPRSLTEICDKALLKKPEARYQSVAEMVAAILSARLNHHRGTKARTAVGIVVGSVSLTIATFGLCLSLFEYLDIAWTYWAAFICASFGVAAGSLLEAIYSPVLSVEVGKKTSKTHAIGRAG